MSPVSHWTCDETSGVRYDSTATNNDLTDNNTVAYATGLLSNACDFEASNSEYLSITDVAQTNLDFTSNFSISVWLKPESLPGTNSDAYVVSKWDGGINQFQYITYLRNQAGTQALYASVENSASTAGGPFTGPNHTLSTSAFTHVVWVYTASLGQIDTYVNGSSIGSNTGYDTSVGNRTAAFTIGSVSAAGFYDGLMDEITVFNTALSSSDVTTLYNSGTPLPYTATSSGTSTSATSTVNFEDDNIVFALSVIVFFLSLIFTGLVFNTFRRK